MSVSLKQRSKNLTSISLECFINDITGEGQNYYFSQLLIHPNIHTIKPQFHQLLTLFIEGTFHDYLSDKSKVPELNTKQINTLRRLTLLKLFKGIQKITIAKLQQALRMNSSEVVDLLLMMNINGMANVKINEEDRTITILKSEIRAAKINENNVTNAKISNLIQKNKKIEQDVNKLIDSIK